VSKALDYLSLIHEPIDLIIPVASGGFEPAAIIAYYLGISKMFPVRFSVSSRKDKRVLVPSQAPRNYSAKNIADKTVLIVDDVVATGTTTQKLTDWIRKFDPAKIYFAIVRPKEEILGDYSVRRIPSSWHLYLDHKISD
jgi:hypoxanthine phosphoribosyltransferase